MGPPCEVHTLGSIVERGAIIMGLVVEHIHKSFGQVHVIKDLSMDVREGSIFGGSPSLRGKWMKIPPSRRRSPSAEEGALRVRRLSGKTLATRSLFHF